jgi:pimeloyl-ACP methyl ester carboxylesterase
MAELPPLPELRFAEIPATSRHRYMGDRFSYMEAGQVDLPAVLLLHGVGANSLHWRFQLAGLADRFRPIAWNAPGYLLSDNLRAETPSCRDYVNALDDLLSALRIDGFDIVANSFGTRVAQCFAYYRPGRVRRAVFPGTSIPQGMSPEERARGVEARARMIERGGYGSGTGQRHCSVQRPRLIRWLWCSKPCPRPTPSGSCRQRAFWLRPRCRRSLPGLRCPC